MNCGNPWSVRGVTSFVSCCGRAVQFLAVKQRYYYCTVYDGVFITPAPPGPIFHGRHLHIRNNSVGAEKRSVVEASRRELSEHAPFGIGTIPLVVGRSGLENRPRGGVTYTAVYG